MKNGFEASSPSARNQAIEAALRSIKPTCSRVANARTAGAYRPCVSSNWSILLPRSNLRRANGVMRIGVAPFARASAT